MNFIFQYTHIYTTHTYNYIHIFVSHCIINVIVYGLGGGCSLKAVLPNTPITINIYEKVIYCNNEQFEDIYSVNLCVDPFQLSLLAKMQRNFMHVCNTTGEM